MKHYIYGFIIGFLFVAITALALAASAEQCYPGTHGRVCVKVV
jgi:tetrahydromethanopterin S-methyltransferase subunit B